MVRLEAAVNFLRGILGRAVRRVSDIMLHRAPEMAASPCYGSLRGVRARFRDLARTTRLYAVLLLVIVMLAPASCGSESSTFGQYFQGRTLHVSVVSLERTSELRYSTIDPNQVIRRWSLLPTQPGHELVMLNIKVENHTAVSTFINVDRTAAELRDFSNANYRPLPISETVWQDFRGESEALIRMDLGQCFDGARALIDPGATVRWQSEADTPQYVAFDDTAVPVGPGGRADLAPGESVSSTFSQPGTFPYDCGTEEGPPWPAEVQVSGGEERDDVAEMTVLFLEGSFELLQGHGLQGFLVFEAPVDTEFRDLRWRTGDSITIRF